MKFKLYIFYYLIVFFFRRNARYSRKKIMRSQKKGFDRLLVHLRKSEYYKKFLNGNTELSDFPVTGKKEFMLNFDRINTRGITLDEVMEMATKAEKTRDFSENFKGITVGLSSGTSGSKGLFLVSERERAQWVAIILNRVIGFSLRKRKIAFFLRSNSNLYGSVNSALLKFRFFDLISPLENQINDLNNFNPDILVGQPSLLMALATKIKLGRLNIHPKKIISVAEVLTPEDEGFIEAAFSKNIHQVYQCTEGFLACTCKYGTLHFNEDLLIVEKKYIDAEKTRFHPIITDLYRITQPVIRYELDDIIIEKPDCKCGIQTLAAEKIEGRSDDILLFKDRENRPIRIFPDFFRRAILFSDPEITDYMVIQSKPGNLKVYINSSKEKTRSRVKHELGALFSYYNINEPEIDFINEKPFYHGEKLRRIKNENCKTI
ncbi:MAG: F390 synthetase-related protein [Bacteroidales bacterium]